MKWIAIAGSWRQTNKKVEADVRKAVKRIIKNGDGIVSGGALGVDYFALDEAMKNDKKCQKIKIFLPAALKTYLNHLQKRAKEKIISFKQYQAIKEQLKQLKKINPSALKENKKIKKIEKKAYYNRIKKLIKRADSLIAFWVNKSQGTAYTILQAKLKKIPIKIYSYRI